MQITPGTALCGIVLHPAGHTRSPAMHNAAYAALGIDAAYLAFDVAPEHLADAVRGMRGLGIRQLSVSIPHKESILGHLDDVDETARRIGAVNTVVRDGGRLLGSNTDWQGAVRALEREIRLDGKRAVVLGAGGAARAVAFGLAERGAHVQLLNRTEGRARAIAADLDVEVAGDLGALSRLHYDVLVNTTSVGLGVDASPVDVAAIAPDAVVMDIVYEPEQTRLLRDAQARGARIVPGKWMLVHQAAAQLEAWSGKSAPEKVMAEAFDAVGTSSEG